MTDSLCVANPVPLVGTHIQSTCDWINLASEIAMIVIAIINIVTVKLRKECNLLEMSVG